MANSEFEKSWNAFSKAIDTKSVTPTSENETADIDHLLKLGAHRELISVAKCKHLAGPFNIAPNTKAREYTPDWMFKNAISIGGDGCGNHFVWMDVSRLDSPVLFICHDPAEVLVIAETPAVFFENLQAFISTYKFKNYFDFLSDYLDEWEPPRSSNTSIVHISEGEKDIFDFNAAQIGDGVDLDYRGKHTIVEEARQPGVLILATESQDIIDTQRRRDRLWTFGFMGALVLVFSFFYAVKNKSILASLGLTFFVLMMFGAVFSIVADAYYSYLEKRKHKKH